MLKKSSSPRVSNMEETVCLAIVSLSPFILPLTSTKITTSFGDVAAWIYLWYTRVNYTLSNPWTVSVVIIIIICATIFSPVSGGSPLSVSAVEADDAVFVWMPLHSCRVDPGKRQNIRDSQYKLGHTWYLIIEITAATLSVFSFFKFSSYRDQCISCFKHTHNAEVQQKHNTDCDIQITSNTIIKNPTRKKHAPQFLHKYLLHSSCYPASRGL